MMRALFIFVVSPWIQASAHLADDWNGLDNLASNWLHGVDGMLRDKIARFLGVAPGLREGCQPTSVIGNVALPFHSTRLEEEKNRYQRMVVALKKERRAKQRRQRQTRMSERRAKQAMDESMHLMSRIDSMAREHSAMASQIRQLETERRAKQAQAETEISDAEFKATGTFRQPKVVCLLSNEPLSCFVPASAAFVLVPVLAALLMVFAFKIARPHCSALEKQMHDKTAELVERIAQLTSFDEEHDGSAKISTGMEQMSESLDNDFSFYMFDTMLGEELVRSIKIKCPGVRHDDVIVDIMFNEVVVTIDRKASHGVDATEWVKRFQFTGSIRLFELKDDQVTLDDGFLTLVFQAFRSRIFQFPRHFDMAVGDAQDAWLFSNDSPAGHSPTLARTSQALRMAAAVGLGNAIAMPSHTTTLGTSDEEDLKATGEKASSSGGSSCAICESFEKL